MREIERTRAIVDLQRKKLRDTTIYAPEAGHVKERLVNVGQYVRPNTPVFTLVKIDPIRLRIEAPERMAPWVKTGQFADVSLEARAQRVAAAREQRAPAPNDIRCLSSGIEGNG